MEMFYNLKIFPMSLIIIRIIIVLFFLALTFLLVIYIGESITYLFPNSFFTKWWRKNIIGRLPNDDLFF